VKKLMLKVEDIDVAGFETLGALPDRTGTVQGAEFLTIRTNCDQVTCGDTCAAPTCVCRA
jgi:hypothetical protein